MDPPNTGDILRHLEKQNELLMDAYNSQSHELHKLQVEEEMLMRKFFELMSVHGLAKKQESGSNASEDNGLIGQSTSTSPHWDDDTSMDPYIAHASLRAWPSFPECTQTELDASFPSFAVELGVMTPIPGVMTLETES